MALGLQYGIRISLPSVCGNDPSLQMSVHGVLISIPATCNRKSCAPTMRVQDVVSADADVNLQDALEFVGDGLCSSCHAESVQIEFADFGRDAQADGQRQAGDPVPPVEDKFGTIRHDVQAGRQIQSVLPLHLQLVQNEIGSVGHELQADGRRQSAHPVHREPLRNEIGSVGYHLGQRQSGHPLQTEPAQNEIGSVGHDVQADARRQSAHPVHMEPAQNEIGRFGNDFQEDEQWQSAHPVHTGPTQNEIGSIGHDLQADGQKQSAHQVHMETTQNEFDKLGHDVQVYGYDADMDDALASSSALGIRSAQDQAAGIKLEVSFPRLSFRPFAQKASTGSTAVGVLRPSLQVSPTSSDKFVAEPSLKELVDALLSDKSSAVPDAQDALGPQLIKTDVCRWGAELFSSCPSSLQGHEVLSPTCSWPEEDEPKEEPACKRPAHAKSAQTVDGIYADFGCDCTSGAHAQEWSAQPKSAAWPVRQHTPRSGRASRSDSRARSRSRRGNRAAGSEAGAGEGSEAAARQFSCSQDTITDHNFTTIMLRNLPKDLSRETFTDVLDKEGFRAGYNFVYMPTDFQIGTKGAGFAFVNLLTPTEARAAKARFQGFRCTGASGRSKVCNVKWCDHQGFEFLVQRFRNSAMMHASVPEFAKPMLYQDGAKLAFPPPTKAIKMPKMRSYEKRANCNRRRAA